ncbi:hypothetical protein N185_16255 [Sinorhizobium sp. GW3]|nr:hypothetical protein N185_16255 [Sinorhizobium sp. GW3]
MAKAKPILTPNAPEPSGHYSQAVLAGGFIYVSGQLPIRVEGQQSDAGFEAQANLALSNLLAVLDAGGAKPSHVVKVTAYIVGVENWGCFNAAYANAFGQARPARSVVPVPALHHGYLIELDAVAYIP